MEVFNVTEIFDNGEFVTLVLNTKSVVHLPEGTHSIVIREKIKPNTPTPLFDVVVDLHEGGH